MEKIPEDLFPIILSYIKPKYKYNLNKTLFNLYYEDLNLNKIYGKHSYLIKVIRYDYFFIFDNICKIKWNKWVSLKNWRYKDFKFANFTNYIYFLINNLESHKCKNIYLKYCNNINSFKHMKRNWSN